MCDVMHPMTWLRNHVFYTRVLFFTVFVSYSSAGLGLYPGQGVNISKKLNSALLHVYTDLQQIIETLNRENQHSILTRTPPFPEKDPSLKRRGSCRNRVRVFLIEGFKDLLQVGMYMQ